jgi:hypothetical protein
VEHFLRLEKRGLPMLAGTFELALSIGKELCDFVYKDPKRLNSAQRERGDRVLALRERLRRADTYASPGGLFQVYEASPLDLKSDLVGPSNIAMTR